ncbi:MAG: cytidine/deoxycytidylate deaminase family protein [Eubacteriales bacterium]|nr:cytidine/deoxycytidylate deaminase family protein [Eubacteriales bacterium]
MAQWNKWDHRFMEMADLVATWSSCFQPNRQIGAVIVREKRILTTGYNGAPAGVRSCKEKGECLRRVRNIPSGQMAEFCYAIHAEQNAIIQAARMGISLEGATLYCTHQPCSICSKMIVNAGIKRIVYRYPYPDEFALQIIGEAGIAIEHYLPESSS